MALPWRTLSSRTLLQDRWIDLRADDCETAGGVRIAPYYVLGYPDWVHVVAITQDQHVVLVEQYRHGAGITSLEPPGGVVDAGDADVIAAGQRELREESGFAADDFQLVASLYANPATQPNRNHTVLATGCRRVGNPQLEAGEEGLVVRCLPVSNVLAGLRNGLLSQSMHVAGMLLALDVAGLR